MTFPPGPPDAWSAPPPQFGGPQQPGTPNPFGMPGQPYGGPPPYQPHGGPPPYQAPGPYGYGMPSPGQNNSKRTALILGGIGGAIILLVVIVVAVVMGTGSGPYSDERAIKQVFEDIGEAGSASESMKYFCAEDQQMMKKYESSMPDSFDADIPEATGRPGSVELTEVKVDGDRATATVVSDGESDGSAYFRKEDGDWKLCMAEDPHLNPGS